MTPKGERSDTNEAAERLRKYVRSVSRLMIDGPFPKYLDAALAAERRAVNEEWNAGEGTVWHYDCGLNEDEIRRATVERIRAGSHALMYRSGKNEVIAIDALALILDEEAAR